MSAEALVLLAEGDPSLGELLSAVAARHGAVQWVRTADDALRTVSTRASWRALVVDHRLTGRHGLDIVARARSIGVPSPALVLVDAGGLPDVDRGFDLDASFVSKPPGTPTIEAFADRVERFVIRGANLEARLRAVGKAWTLRYHLLPAEIDILLRSARGESRALIALERKSSDATVKKHVSNILQKTTDESFASACARLVREAAAQ